MNADRPSWDPADVQGEYLIVRGGYSAVISSKGAALRQLRYHAFTALPFDDGWRAGLILRDPAGTGVGMSWDRSCPWLQLHTADRLWPLPNRLGLAVEPMTCPPDSFNSGADLVRLEPGQQHSIEWRIFGI